MKIFNVKHLLAIGIILSFISCNFATDITDLQDKNHEENQDLLNLPIIKPITHYSFSGELTEKEINNSVKTVKSKVNPTDEMGVATPGLKLIQISTVTGTREYADNDKSGVYFIGQWVSNTNTYRVKFLLDLDSRDDLEKGRTDVFYYLINPSDYAYGTTRDKMTHGLISNETTDGWFCERVYVKENNYLSIQRNNTFPYSMWVDQDSGHSQNSGYRLAPNSSQWLEFY